MPIAGKNAEAVMRLFYTEDGQGLTEYSLLLGLIAAVVVTACFALGGSIVNVHEIYADAVSTALGGGS